MFAFTTVVAENQLKLKMYTVHKGRKDGNEKNHMLFYFSDDFMLNKPNKRDRKLRGRVFSSVVIIHL